MPTLRKGTMRAVTVGLNQLSLAVSSQRGQPASYGTSGNNVHSNGWGNGGSGNQKAIEQSLAPQSDLSLNPSLEEVV